jgi:hypothetical protein
VSGVVTALEVHAGTLIVGGSFTGAGGVAFTTNLARWTGTAWRSLDAGTNGAVTALLSRGDSLFVGGYFTAVNDTASGNVVSIAANHIALWDETPSSPAVHWVASAFGAGTSDAVLALADFGSAVAVGGKFDTVGASLAANHAATWTDGVWSALGVGMGGPLFSPDVRALASFGGDLYAGGWFATAGGVPSQFVARWTASSRGSASARTLPVSDASVERVVIRASPNPFSEGTLISLTSPAPSYGGVAIYDVAGREVRRLHAGPAPRELSLRWDGRSNEGARVPTGIYYIRAESGPDSWSARSVVLVR